MTIGRSPDLDEIFQPSSVAVIGASNKPGKVGTYLFRNIIEAGFKGVVYPVNPSSKSVSGVRCYPSIEELPETPDLGVIIVPAATVGDTIDQLGKAGSRGAVIISAGFRELGETGAALEADVVRRAAKYKMSIVGPNCFGVINTAPDVSLNSTFSATLPPRGNIAFVSQSGALCAGILAYGITARIGFSRFVSVGNRAGIDENDLLYSLGQDEATKVILLYLESLVDGRKFLETAREVTERKPVLVIKGGRTPAGERAAKSHTGSLAQSGQDLLYDALFNQAGVQRTDTLGELFRTAKIFSSGLELEGPRLMILTNSGGPGIVAADAAVRNGLELPPLSHAVHDAIAPLLSPSASVANPTDMTADAGADHYRQLLEKLLEGPDMNGALVITTPTSTMTAESVARAILAAKTTTPKPIAACIFGVNDLSNEVSLLEEHGVPTFTFPEEAAQGLGALVRYHAWRTRPKTPVREFEVDHAGARAVIERARHAGTTVLSDLAARALLTAYGIRFPEGRVVHTLEEATEAAEGIEYPVVLKVVSPDLSHKTDVGGVALGIHDSASLRTAWESMQQSLQARAHDARVEGFEVETEIQEGKEVLVGVQRDSHFGPILAFGLGGIYVEVLRDVTFRLAPVRPLGALNMVQSVKAFPLLRGVRGEAPSDIEGLVEVIERVSQLAMEVPDVVELDINPLIVLPDRQGAIAADARVVLAPVSRLGPSPSAAR
ncbi:MAG TPA: acetate--CoA ligase family protein [Thermoplasmata archaeon]|jgi:acetyltransferase|nr:acetate--CoA ligase family protein [Thermoplasmata archaeon]